LAGGSNRRIVRTTLDFFYEKLNKGENLEDYLAVIQWSDIGRTERFKHDSWWYMLITGSAQDASFGYRPKYLSWKECEHARRFYYKDIQHDIQDFYDTIEHLTALSGFFTKYKIPYVFIHLNGIDNFTDAKLTEHQRTALDTFNWYSDNFNTAYVSSLYDGFTHSVSPQDGHPNRQGHADIATSLSKYIIEKKLLSQ
jgi:hypothetical protein